ncbi:hypothetical protein BJX64DRAFT_269380 [Aspergillus heterothallicus]
MATDPKTLHMLDWTDAGTEHLFDKAINSPAEITEEEKHLIAEWPPSRSEMEARTQQYLDQSLDSLFEQAATDPESLLYPQISMLDQGFHLLGRNNTVGRQLQKRKRAREQPQLQAKWEQARAAVLSDIELEAILNVQRPGLYSRLVTEHLETRNQASAEARGRPAPWVQQIIDRGGDKGWGYVVYCHLLDKSEEWEQFQSRFQDYISEFPMGLGTDEIWGTKVADFTRFEGSQDDFDAVRENFRALREQGLLKPGVLPNVVLYITPECRSSCENPGAMYPWLWALDPDWSLDGPDDEGYHGRLPVNWAICYDKFYNFVSTGKWSLKDMWKDFNQVRQRMQIPGWGYTDLDKPRWPDC